MVGMTSPYAVPLDRLEAGVRVAVQDQVQEQSAAQRPDPDPGPPHPDREWSAAGG